MWCLAPVVPVTLETETGELLEPGGRGCSEPSLCHCTPAWATRVKICVKKKKKRKEKEKEKEEGKEGRKGGRKGGRKEGRKEERKEGTEEEREGERKGGSGV